MRITIPQTVLTCLLLAATNASAQENVFELAPLSAYANRLEPVEAVLSPASISLQGEEISLDRFTDVTQALQTYSGFATFRRTHTFAAHPTAQGVRIRNVGANATSRALVLRDGVPLNDPFGAWIYWHQIRLGQTEFLSVNPAGNGGLWGNFGAGGQITFVTRDRLPGAASIQSSVGTAGRFELDASSTQALSDQLTLDLAGSYFTTDGFHTLLESQRGPVDQKANSDSSSLNARLNWTPSEDWQIRLGAETFQENRGNGTALAVNETDALNLSLLAERRLSDDARLNLVLYHQDRDFQNVFTSVADDRASESPALDQYDVPATAYGAAIVYHRQYDDANRFSAGVDFRETDGSVFERFRNLGNGFTRERQAGGKQAFVGGFASLSRELDTKTALSVSARVDEISNSDAFRSEFDLQTGEILRDDTYADRSNTLVSTNLQLRRDLSDTLAGHITLFNGFRAPTLNELYRPFRVRNDITESNPQLANERQKGIEVALLARREESIRIRLAAFHYRLDETVANALLTTASGFDPRFGFIPEGGSGSQRVNLDESTVSGIELQFERTLSDSLLAHGDLSIAETNVETDELAQFEGKEFPQSAAIRANLGLAWQSSEALSLWTRYSWTDRAWEDLGNTTRLGAADSLSIGATYELNSQHRLSLVLDNAFDTTSVTGISNDGLVTIDAPRELRLVWTWKR